jgi:hypothetical protein
MKKLLVLAFLFCLVSVEAKATSLDLSLNDFSIQGQLSYPLEEDNYGTSLLKARFLHNDHEETTLGSLGFDFLGEMGNVPGLELGVGSHLYGGHTDDDQDLLALGIGGQVNFFPPAWGGFGVSGKIFYAPRILSLLDAERILETGVRISYAFTPKIRAHVGYQKIRTDFENRGNQTIDEGVRVGFEAYF